MSPDISESGGQGRSLPPVFTRRFPLAPIDALVILTTFVWGGNYAVVKTALREIPELGFNALRLGIASLLFVAVLSVYRAPSDGRAPRRRLLFETAAAFSAREWAVLAGLAVFGHFLYQLCFMGSVARTSVANSSLILGTTPVAIAMLSAAVGQERVSARHWIGAAVSLAGVYLLVGVGAAVSAESLRGDLLMMGGVCCWAVYVVVSAPLLRRHSPLALTGYTMALGSLLYMPFGIVDLEGLEWSAISPAAWSGLVFSAVFALFACYIVWHTAIQRIGNIRTALYSNLIPVSAMATAALFLGDRITGRQIIGAAAVLVGVGIARFRAWTRVPVPPEE